MTITVILIIVIIILIIGPFIYQRRELTCSKCGSRKTKKTGNKKELPRSNRAILAEHVTYYKYEYECLKCSHRFWSTIERSNRSTNLF